MSFRKLQAQVVLPTTVPLLLNQLVGEHVLHVVYLGESNAEFWNDALARANAERTATTVRRKATDELTHSALAEARERNCETLARFAIKGLDGFAHDDGRVATLEDVPAILRSLPSDVIDSIWAFVNNTENFRNRKIEGDARELAGK